MDLQFDSPNSTRCTPHSGVSSGCDALSDRFGRGKLARSPKLKSGQ